MKIRFSKEFSDVLEFAAEEAMRTGHSVMGVDHLLLGILRQHKNGACESLASLGIDLEELKKEIDGKIFREQSIPYWDASDIKPSKSMIATVSEAAYEALKSGRQVVRTPHLLLAIMVSQRSIAEEYLNSRSVNYTSLKVLMESRGMLSPEQESGTAPITNKLLLSVAEQISRDDFYAS